MAEDELIIRTEGLSRHFKKKPSSGVKKRLFQKSEILKAVENVSIEVKRGEIFGLIGPNGAGKTTLIKMLSTLILPTSGGAWVNGHDVLKEDEKVRSSLGLLIEVERSFYYRLSGRQNLNFFAMLYNLGKKDAEARIKEVLKLVKLDDKANEKYMTYSTGQKHRLGIARSILHEPAVLIYDEPTASLDPASAHYIRGLIKDLKEGGKTVFLSTHNMQEAEELCNRLAVMHKGQIVKVGTPQELRMSIGGEGVTLEDVFMKLTGASWSE